MHINSHSWLAGYGIHKDKAKLFKTEKLLTLKANNVLS